jgi:hypothetical protein
MVTIKQINNFILSEYSREFRAFDIFPLDVGYFVDLGDQVGASGCVFLFDDCRHWRLETRIGEFCLRRWGKKVLSENRLQFIQAVLWQAKFEGIEFIPLPIETLAHRGFVTFDGSFWELLPWVSGVEITPPIRTIGFEENIAANATTNDVDQYDEMTIQPFQIVSAMMSLAQFHLAVETFPIPNPEVGHSTIVNNMLTKWRTWTNGGFNELYQAIREQWRISISELVINFAETGLRFQNNAVIHAGRILADIGYSTKLLVQIQPIIGNCCLQHLRFDCNGVCGMLGFKKIGIDSVTIDVASLLGSMANSETEAWNLGLRAYQHVRQLDDYEIFMLKSLHQSMILLEGLDHLSDFFLHGKPINEYQIEKITNQLEYWNLRMETENQNRNSA